jgi:predicted TIM-barrel fold metal-dependent hydrolase
MRPKPIVRITLLVVASSTLACNWQHSGDQALAASDFVADPELTAFIAKIRAVDNHAHANSVVAGDSESDALPLEVLLPFEIPARLRPDHPGWILAYRSLYGYAHDDLAESHLPMLRDAMRRVAREKGDRFPEWVLDRVGTEVTLANRVAMGPGLVSPRFRWVSYVDALMLPLSTAAEAAESPDREKLYPFEDKLLRRYMADLGIETLPATLETYLATVVTATLERQRQAGCVAVKFEAAFLRSLDFDPSSDELATRAYARYVRAGTPSHAEYKLLQDFIFRHIAREAGRLGMAVHIHSFEAPGSFYRAAGADPLLLESAFNDPTLRATSFVIVHGGGAFASHAGAMLWKPNVYVDMSAMTLIYTPAQLADVLREWLLQYPEKVLFGTDAAAFGPDCGWELAAWVATTTGRQAVALALTGMMRNGEVSRARAEEIATMVMRANAVKLYGLDAALPSDSTASF